MFDLDFWNEIWETIRRNKRRSIMTAFGVVWGVFMLTTLSGASLYLKRMIQEELGSMSINLCAFSADATSVPYLGMQSGRYWSMNEADFAAIQRLPGVEMAAAIVNPPGEIQVSYDTKKESYPVSGFMPAYQQMDPQKILYGRYINQVDMEQKRKVCVIGMQVSEELFGLGVNPVGKQININGGYYTVVGVMITQGLMMQQYRGEQRIFIPFSTLQQVYNLKGKVDLIFITGRANASIKQLEEASITLLKANHQIAPNDQKAILPTNMSEEVGKIGGLISGIDFLAWLVGGGTLLAGIIGISNIMLVVVRERTQEIGVRRALGAPPSKIITQIMCESFSITFVAGMLGVCLGVGLLSVADMVISSSAKVGEEPISCQISFGMGMLYMGLIVLGSLLAGAIPANRALTIKPVDAIREE